MTPRPHSPGPFRAAWDGEDGTDLAIVDRDGRAVCLVAQHPRGDSRTLANADLLAEAPELLRLIDQFRAFLQNMDPIFGDEAEPRQLMLDEIDAALNRIECSPQQRIEQFRSALAAALDQSGWTGDSADVIAADADRLAALHRRVDGSIGSALYLILRRKTEW